MCSVDTMRPWSRGALRSSTSFLSRTFELVHKSGYAQSKDEWLNAIDTEEFAYHSIQIGDAIEMHIEEGTAEITGRGVFDATVSRSMGAMPNATREA